MTAYDPTRPADRRSCDPETGHSALPSGHAFAPNPLIQPPRPDAPEGNIPLRHFVGEDGRIAVIPGGGLLRAGTGWASASRPSAVISPPYTSRELARSCR